MKTAQAERLLMMRHLCAAESDPQPKIVVLNAAQTFVEKSCLDDRHLTNYRTRRDNGAFRLKESLEGERPVEWQRTHDQRAHAEHFAELKSIRIHQIHRRIFMKNLYLLS